MSLTKQGTPDPKRSRDEKLVLLLRHLFHGKFCEAENVPPEKRAEILPAFFCGWLDANTNLMDPHEECEAAGVEADTWEHMSNVIASGAAPEAMFGVWYSICMPARETKHELHDINVVVNLTWSDKTISTLQAFVSREMFENDEGFTDHIVAGILRNNMRALLDRMVAEGLDKLHDESQKANTFTSVAPEDPFEVLMGWIIKHMLRGEPIPPGHKLKPELVKPVENYMRLAQQCIRMPIPKHIVDGFKARQRQLEGKEAGKPRGGWDA